MDSPSYQTAIIVLHWLGWTIDRQIAVLSAEIIHRFLPYNIKFIFPQASTILVNLNIPQRPGPRIEPAWYNIISLEDLENGENDHGLLDSIKWIEELIKGEIDKGIPSQNIFIAGISQGGSLALAIAMTSQYQLGGFLALGSFIPYPKILKKIETEKNKQVPIFMGHGKGDELVPYEASQRSALILCQKGYHVEFKDYARIGHEPLHFILMIIDRIGLYGDIFQFFQSRNLPKGNVVIVEVLNQTKTLLD